MFDFFYGSPIRITLNYKPLIKSNLGGFLSILTVIVVSICAVLLGQDIIDKKTPYLFVQENVGNVAIPITVKQELCNVGQLKKLYTILSSLVIKKSISSTKQTIFCLPPRDLLLGPSK